MSRKALPHSFVSTIRHLPFKGAALVMSTLPTQQHRCKSNRVDACHQRFVYRTARRGGTLRSYPDSVHQGARRVGCCCQSPNVVDSCPTKRQTLAGAETATPAPVRALSRSNLARQGPHSIRL